MPQDHTQEIWVLGATGRIGRAAAERIAGTTSYTPVLVGRNESRLAEVAHGLNDPPRIVVAGSASEMADQIRSQQPAVVVNTVGAYAETAALVARACMAAGAHYVDLANDLAAMAVLFDLHDEAIAADTTLVTGAGFGVLATEAVVVRLCAEQPEATQVRVDALSSTAMVTGTMGEALAASIVDVLTTGGRQYRNGILTPVRLGSNPQQLTPPDGSAIRSAGMPSGELHAAHAASGAPSVVATSALAPTAPAVRAILPVAGRLLSVAALRRFAIRRLASVKVKAAPRPRPHSWGHAVVDWPDGTRREGWLRADDAMDYTVNVVTVVAAHLAAGDGPAGAYMPAAALGSEIAAEAGGTFILA